MNEQWSGRRVLVTGHTGFKGSWLCSVLVRAGARVTGFALAPEGAPNLFDAAGLAGEIDSRIGDVRDLAAVDAAVAAARPEFAFHLAAQALVRRGYREPVETYATNVMGTVHVLDAIRRAGADARAVVVVTSDKVYADAPVPGGYREDARLGGADPYAGSKAAAELAVETYRSAYLSGGRGPNVATARAGNVIGGGDYSEDRLLPDFVRAIAAGKPLVLRHPDAIRPWQHVLDPVAGYLRLAERLAADASFARAWNFGPSEPGARVRDVIDRFARGWGAGASGAYAVEPSAEHETAVLEIDAAAARTALGWRSRWPTATAVERAAYWYRSFAENVPARELVAADIVAYDAAG